MRKIVNGEAKFSVPTNAFAVQSTAAFTLNYSVNGKNWKAYDEATPANEPMIVKNDVKNMYYMLEGNTDTKAVVIY